MADDASVAIRFKDVERDEELNENLEASCAALAEEFPETTHFEVHLGLEAGEVSVHAHVSGRNTQFASHARASKAHTAAEAALEKLARELRRHHDKQIFSARREAQRIRANR